ncbi:MAG: L,D-transpeptidase family protein [Planctomycetota bacterium]|jgi:lipoprotein-anchoring transpeptidase ErfK/SrfK|nr:L,D-transpeptidase family protein [Planctomycetota bacterium]
MKRLTPWVVTIGVMTLLGLHLGGGPEEESSSSKDVAKISSDPSPAQTEIVPKSSPESEVPPVRPSVVFNGYEGDPPLSPGMKLLVAGSLQQATALLNEEVSAQPDARGLHAWALALRALGDANGARNVWSRLLQEFPKSPYAGDATLELARFLVSGDPRRLQLFDAAFRDHPTSHGGKKAGVALADELYQSGQWKRSRDIYSHLKETGALSSEGLERSRKRIADIELRLLRQGEKAPKTVYHQIEQGDSLWKIARRYQTSIGIIKMVNNLSGNSIHPGERLEILKGDIKLVVCKDEYCLQLLVGSKVLREYKVGLGKNNKTPVGRFVVATKQKNPDWYYRGRRIPFGDPRNELGTRWMGFKNRPGLSGYGIHGTIQPQSIGQDMSNGCIRMRNQDVEELFELVPRGTMVLITAT